jgi:hypothetical protein
MRKTIMIVLFTALVISGCTLISRPGANQDSPEQIVCKKAGGNWEQFRNGCVDNCFYVRNASQIACTQDFTYGCECGKNKCWNAETKTCEPS